MNPLPEELRERLRVARLQGGLGYKTLTRITGLDPHFLRRIEQGARRPSATSAGLIGRALALDSDTYAWLLSEAAVGAGRDRRAGGARACKSGV